ncbi:hypothetical protein [Motiliproteus sediminis]|uniref:hypothetical protein n=1 Tax=Motiliproteus sediminis TaxID=1468178 RepID=UPI001AEF8D47|nr:hypothetical protein [Motiliproteus sediminis]
MNNDFGKKQWSALFTELGLSEAEMRRWHQLFERHHPQDHGRFLSWLGLNNNEVQALRRTCAEQTDG